MNQKNIKKHLLSKIDDWLETIDNPIVKEVLKTNIIVTGGSIGSLVMGEKVNDYDIYLKSKKAVKIVAEYYLSKIPNLQGTILMDGEDRQAMLDAEHFDETASSNSQKHIALKNLEEDRVRLYIPQQGYLAVEYEGEIPKYSPVFLSANCISLSNDIQVVLRFYGQPDEIHKNFDFLHATNYFTYSDNKLVLKDKALVALINKELLYIGSKYPITSIIRTRKFIERGYTIDVGTYLKILYQVSKLDLDNVDVLEEQLFGVDIVVLENLISLMREKLSTKSVLDFETISDIITECFDHTI